MKDLLRDHKRVLKIGVIVLVFAIPILIFGLVIFSGKEGFSIGAMGRVRSVLVSGKKSILDSGDFLVRTSDYEESEKKNITELLERTEEIDIPLEGNENQEYVFNNEFGLNQNFSLLQKIEDKSLLRAVYDAGSRKMNFVIPENELWIGNEKIVLPEKKLFSVGQLDPGMILRIGESYFLNLDYLGNKNLVSYQAIKESQVRAYRFSEKNLLDDNSSSFEKTLWSGRAFDCSKNSSGEAKISVDFSNESTKGKKSMRISSENHNACVGKTFELPGKGNSLYKISFDYKALKGEKVGYFVSLADDKGQTIFEESDFFQPAGSSWNHFEKIVDTKGKNFSSVQMFFYAPSDGSQIVDNLYDNVEWEEYSLAGEKIVERNNIGDTGIKLADNITLGLGENKLEFHPLDNNLLDEKSASFEDGLWTSRPFDCNREMSGKPDFSMDISQDASNGSSALRISSRNHNACTNKKFSVDVDPGKIYSLSFDYKNVKGGKMGYYYQLENKEGEVIKKSSEFLDVEDNNWNKLTAIIDSADSSFDSIQVFFYAPSKGNKEVENLYDNVRLEEYASKDVSNYYLQATRKQEENIPFSSVEFGHLNRLQTKIVIHGAKDSFFLSSSEKYNSHWKLYVKKSDLGKPDSSSDSYRVSGEDINRQASVSEVEEFIQKGLISKVGRGFISKNIQGVIRNDNLEGTYLSGNLFESSISERNHFLFSGYENGWLINIDDLCRAKDMCQKNQDGSFDIVLILQNEWFKFVFLGLLVSAGILLVGLYRFIRSKKDIVFRNPWDKTGRITFKQDEEDAK